MFGMIWIDVMFFFFFQAEDGIRDLTECLEFRRVLFRSVWLGVTGGVRCGRGLRQGCRGDPGFVPGTGQCMAGCDRGSEVWAGVAAGEGGGRGLIARDGAAFGKVRKVEGGVGGDRQSAG